jgi:hypothetical protein
MGKKSDFSSECQSLENKLFAFFSKDKATKKPIVSFDRVYQRTSKALGVSYNSVHRTMNGKRPCKSNRPNERAKILDDFDHCFINRTIHGLYSLTKKGKQLVFQTLAFRRKVRLFTHFTKNAKYNNNL